MSEFNITDAAGLKEAVRALTLYDDSPDELPSGTLDTQLGVARLRVKNKTDSTAFYSDDGLKQALLGSTCILAKAAVENYSVSSWDMANAHIDVSGAGDSEQAQFDEWAGMVSEGLSASDAADHGLSMDVSHSYIG